jgi:hypothetical protein
MTEKDTLKLIASTNQTANETPLATHTATEAAGEVTYIIYGAIGVGSITGYTIKRVINITSSTAIDVGFLPESLRASGANGSGANVDLRDLTTAVLLLQDSSIIYG